MPALFFGGKKVEYLLLSFQIIVIKWIYKKWNLKTAPYLVLLSTKAITIKADTSPCFSLRFRLFSKAAKTIHSEDFKISLPIPYLLQANIQWIQRIPLQ